MKLTDEILNRFIDGELDQSEIEEISELLKYDNEAKKKLSDLQAVNSALYKIETVSAPSNITINVMEKILKKSDRFIKDKIFFRFVSVIFGVLTALLVVFGFILPGSTEKSVINPFFEKSAELLKEYVPEISFSLSKTYLIVISASVAIVLFAAIFYLVETHKQFTKKISSY